MSLCTEIPGDAAMYSMIRVWSKPVQCPLQVSVHLYTMCGDHDHVSQGPHSMAYGKGGADKQCTHPPSLMDSCHNDDSVLQVNFRSVL